MTIILDRTITPETEISIFKGKIIIQEINFKNSQKDFLRFQVSTTEDILNLKGIEFYSDKVFKTIEGDYYVKNKDLITLFFDDERNDSNQEKNLYTKEKGLTGTTEQILIKSGNTYLDFFCWQKTPIAQSEKNDFEKIFQQNFWEDSDISSCFESNQIEKDQSLIRINNQNNQESWIADSKAIDKTEESTHNSPNSNEIKSTSNNNLQSELNQIVENSDLENLGNQEIIISEIYPAPEDKNSPEWLELCNQSSITTDLNGWILDDNEKGSKPVNITNLSLEGNSCHQIDLKVLKINLNNTSDQVRIFDQNKDLVDFLEYDKAIKGQYYSLINDQWIWTENPTPGMPNPTLITISGEIISSPEFKEIYYFQLKNLNNEIFQVVFKESLIKGPDALELFTKNTSGEFTGELENRQNYQILHLYQYKLSQKSFSLLDSPNLLIIVTIIFVITSLLLIIKTKPKWKFWLEKFSSHS